MTGFSKKSHPKFHPKLAKTWEDKFLEILNGRNRARVIAESLARVIAATRITSVRSAVISPPKNTESGPGRPCVRCIANRIARLAFVGVVFVPRGPAEWSARADRTPAIGDW